MQGILLWNMFFNRALPKDYIHPTQQRMYWLFSSWPPPPRLQNRLAALLCLSVYQEVDPCGLRHLGAPSTWLLGGGGWPLDGSSKTGRQGWASSPVLPCSGAVSLAAAVTFHDYCSLLPTSPPQLQLSLGRLSLLGQGVTASSRSWPLGTSAPRRLPWPCPRILRGPFPGASVVEPSEGNSASCQHPGWYRGEHTGGM